MCAFLLWNVRMSWASFRFLHRFYFVFIHYLYLGVDLIKYSCNFDYFHIFAQLPAESNSKAFPLNFCPTWFVCHVQDRAGTSVCCDIIMLHELRRITQLHWISVGLDTSITCNEMVGSWRSYCASNLCQICLKLCFFLADVHLRIMWETSKYQCFHRKEWVMLAKACW